MARQKLFTKSDNSSGDYWKIISCHMDRHIKTTQVIVFLYKDKASYDANKHHMYSKMIEFKGSDFDDFEPAKQDELNANVYDTAYKKIELLAPFATSPSYYEYEGVRYTADNPGLDGDEISLVFNGGTIADALSDWNTSHPLNTVSSNARNEGVIPKSATINLEKGSLNSVRQD